MLFVFKIYDFHNITHEGGEGGGGRGGLLKILT